eukprot:6153547-Pleurochrysis_carterae.AAC.1
MNRMYSRQPACKTWYTPCGDSPCTAMMKARCPGRARGGLAAEPIADDEQEALVQMTSTQDVELRLHIL